MSASAAPLPHCIPSAQWAALPVPMADVRGSAALSPLVAAVWYSFIQ